MSTLYVQTKTLSLFWLSVLSVPTLISHYLSLPILFSGPLTSFSPSPHILPSPLLLMMCFDLFSFVIWVICRFLFFIPSLFVCLFPFFLFLVTIDRPFFCAIFSADSLWFMCPSSQPPEGHRGQAQKTQAVKHLFLLSLKSFSLLSSLTCVSFFSPHLPVILLCLYCRSCSVSSPSPSPHHSSLTCSFRPFICLLSFSSQCRRLSSGFSCFSDLFSSAVFQYPYSSPIRII